VKRKSVIHISKPLPGFS